MKKTIITTLAIFLFGTANACDICGCGVGGYYIGILPEFQKHIIGLRYRYNSLKTHLGEGGSTTYLTTKERYQTAELWGAWNIGKKFRIMASVPYAFNERENQGIRNSKNGIGDISVNGYYRLFNDKRTVFTKKILVQSLWICAGIKLPTGKYTPADKLSSTQNTNLFQLGTASFDFSVNAMYEVRIQDAGLNISASYKMNTANKYSYNYGNKLNATAQLYYKIRVKNKFTIAPNAGVMYENSKKDIDNKISVDASGGNLMLGSIGFETGFKKITFGANWQIPLSQNLANGFVNANPRMMAHISFLL
ncbi:MAG: transporter [Chitinophagaceae bacterium]|nr:transporter [Chitinophagaceae bacterium]